MRTLLAVAGSVLVNLALGFAFEHSVDEAGIPVGHVLVTDLSLQPVPSFVRAALAKSDESLM